LKKTTYIQFKIPKSEQIAQADEIVKRNFKKALIGILSTIIPKANPDFENKIDLVETWIFELDNETGIPEREIGMDKNIKALIHHSDRGIQYCSNVYTQILKRKKIAISMTEENHCYENAMAERVNGILKDEFYLDQTFDNVKHAKRATKNAINLYNEIRLHLSLDYKTPNRVYKLSA
jgi:transposase InsO family protein